VFFGAWLVSVRRPAHAARDARGSDGRILRIFLAIKRKDSFMGNDAACPPESLFHQENEFPVSLCLRGVSVARRR